MGWFYWIPWIPPFALPLNHSSSYPVSVSLRYQSLSVVLLTWLAPVPNPDSRFLLCVVVDTGSYYVVLRGLELAIQAGLELTEFCPLCFPSAGIKATTLADSSISHHSPYKFHLPLFHQHHTPASPQVSMLGSLTSIVFVQVQFHKSGGSEHKAALCLSVFPSWSPWSLGELREDSSTSTLLHPSLSRLKKRIMCCSPSPLFCS